LYYVRASIFNLEFPLSLLWFAQRPLVYYYSLDKNGFTSKEWLDIGSAHNIFVIYLERMV